MPLVIVDPRHPGGARTDAVGSHLDMVPTILAYAGRRRMNGNSATPS